MKLYPVTKCILVVYCLCWKEWLVFCFLFNHKQMHIIALEDVLKMNFLLVLTNEAPQNTFSFCCKTSLDYQFVHFWNVSLKMRGRGKMAFIIFLRKKDVCTSSNIAFCIRDKYKAECNIHQQKSVMVHKGIGLRLDCSQM